MSTLLDTNILTRCAQPTHPMCQPATDALTLLRQQGDELCLVPQNFYEFWVVATRPDAAPVQRSSSKFDAANFTE